MQNKTFFIILAVALLLIFGIPYIWNFISAGICILAIIIILYFTNSYIRKKNENI